MLSRKALGYKRVREARLFENWTQQELADRADVALATLKRFELTGEISLTRLVRLASVWDVLTRLIFFFQRRRR